MAKQKNINQWARTLGVNRNAIKDRLQRGLSDKEAITKPFRVHVENKYILKDYYQEYINAKIGNLL